MPKIQQLPASVINKIAAGEVIERPASVLKELLENAVDSGAGRIDATVEQGGGALIRVADDGCGIDQDELTLAVASHATSKIRNADDLFCVKTLGFRGEALASIAEISHFCIRSRTSDSNAGYELEVRGGQYGEIAPCGCPVGTTVEVRNLFHNTPVRRKFLRTTQTEMGHTSEAFTRIALANPHIHMTLQHNGRVLFDLPSGDRWRDRIGAFFGGEINENLIWVESKDEGATLSGFVADPQISRSNNRMQYLFLNGRFIRDRSLQHALGEAYRGLLMTGRFPIAFLKLALPADSIDVNVHPTKLEVRFQDGGRLYSQMLGTLRNKFLTSDLTARVPTEPASIVGEPTSMDRNKLQEHRDQLGAWARGGQGTTSAPGGGAAATQERLPFSQNTPEFQPFPDRGLSFGTAGLSRNLDRSDAAPAAVSVTGTSAQTAVAVPRDPADVASQDLTHTVPGGRPAGGRLLGVQLHNRYLVTENEQGMVVIDQHALHERILYEQIRGKVLAGTLESQKLLVPEPVSLTAAEAATALDARETLARLGIEIEPFGGDTVLLAAYPAMLSGAAPQEVLRQVVDLLMAGGKSPERRDVLDELLHMISCKAAVKAGDRLAFEEVNALLEQREHYQDSHHCPHGRPTALVFTREELDKRFKRI